MFEKLKYHHIGYIVNEKQKKIIEEKLNKQFFFDKIQGTHVLFTKDPSNLYLIEYILKEGRVKNSRLGLAHICYDLENESKLNEISLYIKENLLGFPVTKLEKSGSEECNWVQFYFIKNNGLIEFNVLNKL